MSDSILERVLLSKEDQEKQEFDPLEVINQLLKTVSTKEADVLSRRFGLREEGQETLETIGVLYHVTRERIRQIEGQAINKMKGASTFLTIMRPVDHLIVSLLTHHGGLMVSDMLYESLLSVHAGSVLRQHCVDFIINELLSDKVELIPKSKHYRMGWKLKLTSMEFVDAATELLQQLVQRAGKPQSFAELYTALQQEQFYRENDQKLIEDAILSYVHVSTALARNPFDEYGLSQWGRVVPKRMNDRVFLVLQKSGKPMHFEDIAKEISRVFKKKAYPPTVHNELILNDEYVLVGRGIYALKEWGFQEGVVADVIVDVLKRVGHPMTRSDIVDAVLKQRIVKKNTIHLALTNKTLFTKTADGRYSLAPSAGS